MLSAVLHDPAYQYTFCEIFYRQGKNIRIRVC